jgi:hypothetical protein
MTTATEQKAILESHLTKVAGVAVEITIRGDRSFTISTEAEDRPACEKLVAYFSEAQAKSVSVEHDECGSFVYVEA